jgi:uncharacterized protein YjbJ (UPF0337 family)
MYKTEEKMDKLEIKGNWNVIKGKIKKQYGNLTSDDLTYIEGKSEELIGRLQKKLGKSRKKVIDMINNFSHQTMKNKDSD